jgi:hypothetical protein
MTFDPTIPNANHFISADQPQITINFSQLNSIFDIDHIKYDDGTAGNRGKHKQVTLIAPVAAAAAGTEGIVHSVNGAGVTFNGVPLPFFSNNLGDYPLMGDLLNTSGTNFSFTLGNIIFKLGTGTFSATNGTKTATISFGSAFPTAIIGVYCQGYATGLNAISITTGPTTSAFTATLFLQSLATPTFSYLAIGY